jgi:uridine kinase/nucleoside 2-deoxyribosyltransferase
MTMNKMAFVLIPFKDEYQQLYEAVLEPTLTEAGYVALKADQPALPGDIPEEVIKGIISADVVVADCSEPNPNVFYELGVSHAVGNKTIVLSNDPENLAFYLRQHRVLVYRRDRDGRQLLRANLKQWLHSMSELLPSQPTNLVQRAGGEFFRDIARFKLEMASLREERRRLRVFDEFMRGGRQKSAENSTTIDKVIEIILNRRRERGQHTIVASMVGASGIGKSEFSHQIAKVLREREGLTVSVLGTDAYMLSRAERRARSIYGFDPASHNLDILCTDVASLLAGKSVRVRPYEHSTGEHGEEIEVSSGDVLIVEGVHAFCPGLVPLTAGLRFFLHADRLKAKELKFLADFFDRGYDIHSAFKHADREHEAYEQHTLPMLRVADYVIEIVDYWTYRGPFSGPS